MTLERPSRENVRRALAAVVVGLLHAFCGLAMAQSETPRSAPHNDDEPHGTRHWTDVEGRRFEVAPGWKLELAAGPDLCPRPITASFDDSGNLFVADSSGSNAPVQEQLANPTHRILRLVDVDHDGRFDSSTVFADRMMFPEGTLWHAGSLYVAAPPQIWKLTDRDDDGIAEEREVWFDGQTLTGCANDLHGPYLGRDGWIYWCKGAFAEQTYTRPDGSTWTTRASHIFRRHPNGDDIEPVMSGGMDNPVDVVFTRGGERLFTTTFLTHPGRGERDGVIHAIYGGLYGKDHGVLEGHVRTGPLMPPLVHLGAAAPAGLAVVEPESWLTTGLSEQTDADSKLAAGSDVLAVACFNLHQVMRVPLLSDGATFDARATPWVTAESLDFHPTDVLPDADGSLLVVDTGGWYKLCCPTSQFERPEVLGGIYRLVPEQANVPTDPRGLSISWNELTAEQLASLFDDERPFVRERATRETGRLAVGKEAVLSALSPTRSSRSRLNALWASTRLPETELDEALRIAVADEDALVLQAAAHVMSVTRRFDALPSLAQRLRDQPSAVQRATFEAIGRSGDLTMAELALPLASTFGDESKDDSRRVLEHSLTYALIEIGNDPQRRSEAIEWLASRVDGPEAEARLVAIALDQLGAEDRIVEAVLGWLGSKNARQRETAEWLVANHGEWAERITPRLLQMLDEVEDGEPLPAWARAGVVRPELSGPLRDWLHRKLSAEKDLDALARRIRRLPVEA
ncbi:MAG: hypothetical protein KDA83_17315, partial [Planctomycetales bacterium]|nr:hypothetical protein [Planctomycetales bacterium]